MTKIEVKSERITPTRAEEMLNGNIHNRDLRDTHVAYLANEIVTGQWQQNGETIKFAPDGTLLDGQHRLWAVIESKTAVTSLVAYNVPPESFATIDVGLKRTAGDTLKVSGEKHPTVLANAAIAMIKIGRGAMLGGPAVPNHQVKEVLEANPGLRDCVAPVKQAKLHRLLPTGLGVAFYYLFSQKDAALAASWAAAVGSGLGLERENPFYQLREILIKNASSKAKLSRDYIVPITIKAWNLSRDGRSSKQLKWVKGEKFPAIK